jgi:methionine-rich copper-binding protein CopC
MSSRIVRRLAVGGAGALVLVLVAAPQLLAHAVLTKTTLDGTTVREGTPTTVTLTFNAAIEPGLTKIVLVNEHRGEQPLEVLPKGAPGTVTVTLPPLPPGAYGLRYKVLAADGHVTESVVRFKVTGAE